MRVALVRLREAGQLITYNVTEDIVVHDYVLIEADRGVDYGEVIEVNEVHPVRDIKDTIRGGRIPDGVNLCPKAEAKDRAIKNIVRKLSPEDLKKIKNNEREAKDAMRLCARKVREYKLAMKLVDSEYSFDKKKIVFYFTSEGRVDFRELVKELAKIFKIRIEMRQIGVRDEARLFGGVGPCGQKLCCMRFLKNFEPVSMKMAKAQKLPLSSGKISGICGRLMCCISYEYKNYRELSKGLPKEGQTFETAQGKGKVISLNVLKRLAYVELEDGRIEKVFFKDNE